MFFETLNVWFRLYMEESIFYVLLLYAITSNIGYELMAHTLKRVPFFASS
jgi:hypothetical protein